VPAARDEEWVPGIGFDVRVRVNDTADANHELLSGFIRLHILHHAAEGEIHGQWNIEELACHGCKLSPGTLYRMLHAMEERGYLKPRERAGSRVRRLYRATAHGRAVLATAKDKLQGLVGEVLERR
jgi:PadR family transcriptional regulator, regulatory protein PadR